MTLSQLNILEDCSEAISDQSTFSELSRKALRDDIYEIFLSYLNNFQKDLKILQWDFFSVEFWFDSGQLIIYPEKINGSSNLEDSERLDPYMYLVIEEYQKYFDGLYDKDAEDHFIESESNLYTADVIECTVSVLKALVESKDLYRLLGKDNVTFKFYGVTKEVLIKEEFF